MKPAPSIIGFTTVSGLGYGMLFVLALGGVFGLIPAERWLGVVGFSLALGSITAGLLASTFHLGHPERAWRAISQWRSSWLSREGLVAIVTYIPAVVLAAGWTISESTSGLYSLLAIVAAIGAAATVCCTGKIYATLPPIRAWHQPLTVPVYLAFALMTGLLAVHALLALFGTPRDVVGILTLIALTGGALLKFLYWQMTSKDQSSTPSLESATGLGPMGLVRMLDPPHTQTNYLLNEMGFQVGRKHARTLRLLSGLFGFALPLLFCLVTLFLDHWLAAFLAVIAFVSGMVGVLIERWLFFAEAKHTVMLYYGGAQDISQPPPASAKRVKRDQTWSAAKSRRRRTPPARRRATVKSSSLEAPDHPTPVDDPSDLDADQRSLNSEAAHPIKR